MRPWRRCAALLLVAGMGLAAIRPGGAAPLQSLRPQLPAQAQAGDLLFRQGTEAISQLVRSVDAGDFSHVGLLVAPDSPSGPWRVVHATPSERPGQPDAVVLDTLDFYLHPQRARSYQLYQVTASATARQQAVDWALGQQGRAFDLLDAERGLYCTTLVWQAWHHGGVALEARFTEVMLPLLSGRYLLPGGLRRAPQLQALTPVLRVVPVMPTLPAP
ncbi:YiiX/YebB-like N1pC/P60 family cysteine hydrolase [Comamonas terrigena]|uniref:YiiX/YebB-like N1pC/P60 family cysteine hydrolase n=1 Tax=Comamonas terrigena TaxID=32013 RepID=UPI002447B687|nr:YiiX/YebB-like N1pC/P60 family cysteine hydrolase [Comamonas terrigena]MDH1704271.1 YiiX/YebB-like N1pC/P60 family cysteine hydrolase [Comamonas terrigena]